MAAAFEDFDPAKFRIASRFRHGSLSCLPGAAFSAWLPGAIGTANSNIPVRAGKCVVCGVSNRVVASKLFQYTLMGEGVRLNFPLTPTLSPGRGNIESVSR